MARLGMAWGVGLVLAVVSGGCAGQTGDAEPAGGRGRRPDRRKSSRSGRPVRPQPARRPPDPAGLGEASTLPLLDDSFQAVTVVLCQSALERRADGGTDLVATESRAGDVTALVAALRLPDEPPTTGACTADAVITPYLVLLDKHDHWVRPRVPVNECGKPRTEVRAAIEGLRLTRTSARPIQQVESAEAAAAGCDQHRADMVWAIGSLGTTSERAAPAALYTGPAPVRICIYRVPTDQQRTAKPAGDFVSGRKLTGGQWAGVKRQVEAAKPAAPCTTPAARFALVRTDTGETYVELDNCRRVLATTTDGHDTLRQASATLIALLAG